MILLKYKHYNSRILWYLIFKLYYKYILIRYFIFYIRYLYYQMADPINEQFMDPDFKALDFRDEVRPEQNAKVKSELGKVNQIQKELR